MNLKLRASWALCEEVRASLLAALANVSAAHWSRAPEPGRWSAAQQADHLLKAEVGTSKIVRRLIRGDYKGLTVPEGTTVYDSSLATYPFGPTTAPPLLQPGGLAVETARERLAASHARFFEELQRFTGEDPDIPRAPDPASGLWFTLAGWVRVQALHEAHHVQQIRSLARAVRAEGS